MASTVTCGTHGDREARFVCDHIFVNQRGDQPYCVLYFEPEHAENESSPAIWCEACEAVIIEQGEVNEAADSFARFHMVCDFCLQQYLDNNHPASSDT